jgi:NitT/TauT family transport system substrate-binding protein
MTSAATRWILAAVIILIAGQAQAGDKLSFRFDWSTSATHMPFFLAVQRGWFKAANLDVTLEDGTGSAITVQLVAAGQFDVGHADLSPMAIGRNKGAAVIAVAGLVRGGGGGFIIPNAVKITSLKDFVGKEVLYTAGSLEGPFLAPLFKNAGISLDQVHLLNVSAAAKIPLYVEGHGDVVVSTIPPVLPQAAGHRDSYGIPFSAFGLHLPSFGLIANESSLAAKGLAIRRFVGVICGAWTYILASHEHMVEAADAVYALRPDTPLSKAVMLAQGGAYEGYMFTQATEHEPIGIQSDEDWRLTIADMEAAGVIRPGSKPSDYYTNDYVDRAQIAKIGAGG